MFLKDPETIRNTVGIMRKPSTKNMPGMVYIFNGPRLPKPNKPRKIRFMSPMLGLRRKIHDMAASIPGIAMGTIITE